MVLRARKNLGLPKCSSFFCLPFYMASELALIFLVFHLFPSFLPSRDSLLYYRTSAADSGCRSEAGPSIQSTQCKNASTRVLASDGTGGLPTSREPSQTQPEFKYEYYECGDLYRKNFSRPEIAGIVEEGGKFLMLGLEREQLTKGRMHLAEAMTLARLENRTFVLTRVGDSRIGFDRHLPFCTYFNTVRLAEYVDWITEEYYFSELKRLGRKPSILSLMLHKRRHPCDRRLWRLGEAKKGSERHIFAQNIKLGFRDAVCVAEWPRRMVSKAHEELMRTMQNHSYGKDIIVIFKIGDEQYFPQQMMGAAMNHVMFSAHLMAVASKMISENLGGNRPEDESKFLAVQWRTEYTLLQKSMTNSIMDRCTKGLLLTAERILRGKGLAGLFLATDMSPEGKPISMSFYTLPVNHQHMARDAVLKIHRELQPTTWLGVDQRFTALDVGVQGILDKLLCMKAAMFLFPPTSCGGRSSSFTRDIVGVRRQNRQRFPYEQWQLPVL